MKTGPLALDSRVHCRHAEQGRLWRADVGAEAGRAGTRPLSRRYARTGPRAPVLSARPEYPP